MANATSANVREFVHGSVLEQEPDFLQVQWEGVADTRTEQDDTERGTAPELVRGSLMRRREYAPVSADARRVGAVGQKQLDRLCRDRGLHGHQKRRKPGHAVRAIAAPPRPYGVLVGVGAGVEKMANDSKVAGLEGVEEWHVGSAYGKVDGVKALVA